MNQWRGAIDAYGFAIRRKLSGFGEEACAPGVKDGR